jgi:hypothetical protein
MVYVYLNYQVDAAMAGTESGTREDGRMAGMPFIHMVASVSLLFGSSREAAYRADSCYGYLSEAMTRPREMLGQASSASNLLLQQLADLTWVLARARKPTGMGSVEHSTVDSADDQVAGLTRHVQQDDSSRLEAARVLAQIMRGELDGFTTVQAVVASDLYNMWNLPPGPGAELVADPLVGARPRALGLFAVEKHWASEELRRPVESAICSLAARAAGVSEFAGRMPGFQLALILDDEEMNLYHWLLRALDVAEERAPGTWKRAVRMLPAGNPLRTAMEASASFRGIDLH